jgi:hypothetical protein
MPFQSTALSQRHVTSHAPNSIAFIVNNVELDVRPLLLAALSHVWTYPINPSFSNTHTPSISLPQSLRASSHMFNVGNTELNFQLLYLICSPTSSFFSTTLTVPMCMSNTINTEHEVTPRRLCVFAPMFHVGDTKFNFQLLLPGTLSHGALRHLQHLSAQSRALYLNDIHIPFTVPPSVCYRIHRIKHEHLLSKVISFHYDSMLLEH